MCNGIANGLQRNEVGPVNNLEPWVGVGRLCRGNANVGKHLSSKPKR